MTWNPGSGPAPPGPGRDPEPALGIPLAFGRMASRRDHLLPFRSQRRFRRIEEGNSPRNSSMGNAEPGLTRFVFVTGGVVSSLGKGIASASLGALLEARGLRVTLLKLDPYINVDPGTMSPFQHGEVYVTEDGAETDLDLGHYERFVRTRMTRKNNWTTGRIYLNV